MPLAAANDALTPREGSISLRIEVSISKSDGSDLELQEMGEMGIKGAGEDGAMNFKTSLNTFRRWRRCWEIFGGSTVGSSVSSGMERPSADVCSILFVEVTSTCATSVCFVRFGGNSRFQEGCFFYLIFFVGVGLNEFL